MIQLKHIDGQELVKLMKHVHYQFVDVCRTMEYRMGKMDRCVNMPLDQIGSRHVELCKSQPIVVICESGSRSVFAARVLKQFGFSHVMNVRGGISVFR